jgi:large subunit ribosomal protein L28
LTGGHIEAKKAALGYQLRSEAISPWLQGCGFIAEIVMSKVCQVTGKRALRGHKVSHSNRKTIKFTEPNLQGKRFWLGSESRWIRLRLTVSGMREIDKRGIETVVRELRAAGQSI